MKERNLAVEILKKLLAEQVSLYKRTNLVKSENFSERLAQCMKDYINGLISNEEVIAELMKMAKEMADANAEGNALGLSDEELSFYDALTKPEAVKDIYDNDELVSMTRELADMLRRNRTIDWQKKESTRAGMPFAQRQTCVRSSAPMIARTVTMCGKAKTSTTPVNKWKPVSHLFMAARIFCSNSSAVYP